MLDQSGSRERVPCSSLLAKVTPGPRGFEVHNLGQSPVHTLSHVVTDLL